MLCLTLMWPGLLQAADPIQLTGVDGEQVSLAQPAQRILSLAPHITESLFAIGAGAQIVATVSYSDYPAAALEIPRVGSYDRISIEAAVASAPDLVIAWHSGNGGDVIARLRALGLQVFVSEPGTLDSIADSLRQFALLSGRQQQGDAASEQFQRRLAQLRQRYSGQATVSVFYQLWDQPLLTMNDSHLIADVIRLCGGRNIFGPARPLIPEVGVESVLRADPEVIIASGMGEERPEWLDHWRRWPTLQAVQKRQLHFVPPSLLQRHSTRILDGADLVCEQLQQARLTPIAKAQQNHD
ncbi:cobalamin-binding protein [Pseudomaricurvus alcaniphilus]|uniref:cobalamin-binding protein n=1 Tax=Pseudomaricurvus alcaniphilus TaxID=1166482 RepID=UPI001FB5C8AC|nr:cobalamin-binding protein [Pseudomaricurvus alcaniphilus]